MDNEVHPDNDTAESKDVATTGLPDGEEILTALSIPAPGIEPDSPTPAIASERSFPSSHRTGRRASSIF